MSLLRCLAIARKEFRHITRDMRILLLVTVSPAFLALAFAYVFSFDVERAALTVLDLDHSSLSRQYVNQITADGDFWLYQNAINQNELEAMLLSGKADMALLIPPGFGSDLRNGARPQVQALVDGLETIEARTNAAYLEARTTAFGAELLRSRGLVMSVPVEISSQAWYNESLSSRWSMIPGLLAIVLQMPSLAVALALSRERETGSFEMLITTPVRGSEYLLGKLAAYLVTGAASAALALAAVVWWFDVPFRGSLALFLLLSVLFHLASMGLAQLAGTRVPSQQTAMVIMLLIVFIPSFFLSGLILPIDRTSLGARISSAVLPATHFVYICRGLFLKGSDWQALSAAARSLAAIGVALNVVTLVLFRKRAD